MADINMATIMTYAMPAIKSILMTVMGLGGLGGLAYYLFVIKRQRKWIVDIWEQKADGNLQMITTDILIEKRINRGKQLIYKFKRQNAMAFPPPWEVVFRVRNKEYCNYLRLGEDFLPLIPELEGLNNLPQDKKGIVASVRKRLKEMTSMSKKEIEKDFIYIPITNSISANIKFKPMDFDVNMMRVNALDIREKIYADKMDFLQKYGTFIAFGMIVVLIIVVLYLSYDYSGQVISQGMGKAQETLSMVEQLANKMGGTPPPQ